MITDKEPFYKRAILRNVYIYVCVFHDLKTFVEKIYNCAFCSMLVLVFTIKLDIIIFEIQHKLRCLDKMVKLHPCQPFFMAFLSFQQRDS